MQQPYQTIRNFFDYYGFAYAKEYLTRIVKTAGSEKTLSGRYLTDLFYFREQLDELIDAAFYIVHSVEYRPEVILNKNANEEVWHLKDFSLWCGWYKSESPWDFFPRHLSKKEFLNPYKALEKFTKFNNQLRWKEVVKEFLSSALSPVVIDEFDDGAGILRTYIHLHKLIEAAYLIELRIAEDETQPRKKWKDRGELGEQQTARLSNEQH